MLELRGPVTVELILRDAHGGLPAADWARVIESLSEFVNEFRVSGDEPVEHPQIFDIFEALERTKKFYHVHTGGQWSDPDRFLAGLRKLSYFGSFMFDMPGHTPELYREIRGVDGHAAMAANLQKALACGLEVNTRTTIVKANHDVVMDLAEASFALGSRYAVFYRLLGPPDAPQQPTDEQLLTALERIHDMRLFGYNVALGNCVPNCFHLSDSYGCMGGIISGAVSPTGELLPCACSQRSGGNLLQTSVTEAWRSPRMHEWRNDALPEVCKPCSRLSYCPGGCRATPEHSGGTQDPLIRTALPKEEPTLHEVTLEEELCPIPRYTIREEDFGWVLVRANQVIPVSHKAGAVLQTFDGKTDLGEIERRFGPAALSFIYSLYVRNFVEFRQGAPSAN